jgi:integrase
VPLGPVLRSELERHRQDGELHWPGEPLFRGEGSSTRPWSRSAATRALREVLQLAGVDGQVSSHSFRKWYASELSARGAPLSAVSELLGHADLRTTRLYLGTVPAEVLERAINTLPAPPE